MKKIYLFILGIAILNVLTISVYAQTTANMAQEGSTVEDELQNENEDENNILETNNESQVGTEYILSDDESEESSDNDDSNSLRAKIQAKYSDLNIREKAKAVEEIRDQLEAMKKERIQLQKELNDAKELLNKINAYKFTVSTQVDVEEALARFENRIKNIDVSEEEIARQKELLLEKFETLRSQAREEKYRIGAIPFLDTDDDEWFTVYVIAVKKRNIVSGYKDANGNLTGEFRPSRDVTRAEILKMVLEVTGYGPADTSANAEHWAGNYIQQSQNLGLDFYELVSAEPNRHATRGEVMKLILDVFGEEVPEFVEYKLSDLEAPEGRYIQYAANLGIVDGYPDGTFKQNDTINRAEVSKILKNAADILEPRMQEREEQEATEATEATEAAEAEAEEEVIAEEETTYMDISASDAKALIEENSELIIIDVSPKYDEGHLPGAINYYVGDGSLDEAIPSLDPEATYLVYCHVDSASILGSEKLIEAGFKNVYRLEGNYSAWVDAGYKVEM
ncbi:S-layer homology domain-containing protein [Candidatus Peregrinibacteria bacterium]|nr:S-layer homology domain-containing protein [Candidatus Peregrinibacteria bacterium]